MARDTKQIESLLKGTQKNLRLVKLEIAAGSNFSHVQHELLLHEQVFRTRLKELQAWNARSTASPT
jgi:predicted KAP-like P-loop ATPase